MKTHLCVISSYQFNIKDESSNIKQLQIRAVITHHTAHERSKTHCIVGDHIPRRKLYMLLVLLNIVDYLCILSIIRRENWHIVHNSST